MPSNRVLGGRYEVGAVIGQGGMATVNVGRDLLLHRTVAIKTMRPDLAGDPGFRARFLREARAVAALNHPGIVALHDAGDTGPDGPYLVMEYIDGTTLAGYLAGHRPTVPEVVSVVADVLAALEHSHEQGIVHRDIKPGNVMLTRSGGVKVTDFGIARPLAGPDGLTAASVVVGTAAYLSPEQVTGGPVDGRTDVYATGCLLYVLLTGATPFADGSELTVAYRHVHERPVPPSGHRADVPVEVDRVVLRALAKDPAERYPTAGAMRAALLAAGAAAGPAPATGPPSAAVAAQPAPATAPAGRPRHAHGDDAVRSDGSDDRPALRPTAVFTHPTTAPAHRTAVFHADSGGAGTGGRVGGADVPGTPAPVPRRRPGRKVLVGALCLLLVAAGLGAWAWWPASSVAVPNVIGADASNAADQLRRAGLRVGTVHYGPSADVEKGEVYATDPQPGWLQDPGSTVDLYISDGPPPEPRVPAGLGGGTREQAVAALAPLNVKVTVEYEPSVLDRDVVITTRPGAGVRVEPGDEVTLVLSCGDPDECD
ncbi:protein kinase [Longispora sp. NPDC051575]|uniref:protein kinase domain-containing protein n=1 Tax=Longispora sp. NPDC051575 TaxID=3154943 RepID=UPI0034392AB2